MFWKAMKGPTMENGYRVGQRVRLIEMPDDPCPIEAGSEGVIERVFDWPDLQQLSIEWDNGRSLACVVPPDRLEVIHEREAER